MCGRYTQLYKWKQLQRLMDLAEVPVRELVPRHNLAPTQAAPVVRVGGGEEGRRRRGQGEGRGTSPGTPDGVGAGREGVLMRWGLVPAWAANPSIGGRLINARAESAAAKPSFRDSFRHRRCLVLASGFIEWTVTSGGRGKQPHYFYPAADEPLVFAGLWSRWTGGGDGDASNVGRERGRDPDHEAGQARRSGASPRVEAEGSPDVAPLETFTILTRDADEQMRAFHDRMPVMLPRPAWDAWLDPGADDTDRLTALLLETPPPRLTCHPVSTRLNSPANDEPSLLEPVTEPDRPEQPGLFGQG